MMAFWDPTLELILGTFPNPTWQFCLQTVLAKCSFFCDSGFEGGSLLQLKVGVHFTASVAQTRFLESCPDSLDDLEIRESSRPVRAGDRQNTRMLGDWVGWQSGLILTNLWESS